MKYLKHHTYLLQGSKTLIQIKKSRRLPLECFSIIQNPTRFLHFYIAKAEPYKLEFLIFQQTSPFALSFHRKIHHLLFSTSRIPVYLDYME